MWASRKAEVQGLIARGEPIEGMKVLMREMRAFADRHEVHKLPMDTKSFYSEPAAFGIAYRAAGGSDTAVDTFSEILAERGIIFLALSQPSRALPDLEAAAEIAPERNGERVTEALARARFEMSSVHEAQRRAEETRKVPVVVLTGFLGAGKTTLLNYILRVQHGKRYAVIENEVGKIAIDSQLILDRQLSARTAETITVLDNGCLCCTVRSDLITAITQILDRVDLEAANAQAAGQGGCSGDTPPLDGIIVETTGLADPGPVCKTFYAEERLRQRTRIDGVLTVVDAKHFLEQLRRRRSDGAVNESAQQIGFADKLLLNKVDAVDDATLQSVEAEIRSINAVCPIIRCSLSTHPDQVPIDVLLGCQSFSLDRVVQDLGELEAGAPLAKKARSGGGQFCQTFKAPAFRHDTGVSTCAFTITDAPLILERFTEVMNSLRAAHAVDLYRYKGIVCVKEPGGRVSRAVLQGVHDMCMFEPRGVWPDGAPPRSDIVFIGRNLDAELWGRLFEKAKEGDMDKR